MKVLFFISPSSEGMRNIRKGLQNDPRFYTDDHHIVHYNAELTNTFTDATLHHGDFLKSKILPDKQFYIKRFLELMEKEYVCIFDVRLLHAELLSTITGCLDFLNIPYGVICVPGHTQQKTLQVKYNELIKIHKLVLDSNQITGDDIFTLLLKENQKDTKYAEHDVET